MSPMVQRRSTLAAAGFGAGLAETSAAEMNCDLRDAQQQDDVTTAVRKTSVYSESVEILVVKAVVQAYNMLLQ